MSAVVVQTEAPGADPDLRKVTGQEAAAPATAGVDVLVAIPADEALGFRKTNKTAKGPTPGKSTRTGS